MKAIWTTRNKTFFVNHTLYTTTELKASNMLRSIGPRIFVLVEWCPTPKLIILKSFGVDIHPMKVHPMFLFFWLPQPWHSFKCKTDGTAVLTWCIWCGDISKDHHASIQILVFIVPLYVEVMRVSLAMEVVTFKSWTNLDWEWLNLLFKFSPTLQSFLGNFKVGGWIVWYELFGN